MERDWQPIIQFDCNYLVDINTGDKLNTVNENISKGLDNRGYLLHVIYDKVLKKHRQVQAHRLVYAASHPTWNLFSSQSEGEVHHKDDNKSNNHHSNLEFITSKRKHSQLSSNFKGGVSYDKRIKKWRTRMIVKGKSYFLGYSSSKKEAQKKYNKACIEVTLGTFNHKNYLKTPNPFPGVHYCKSLKNGYSVNR